MYEVSYDNSFILVHSAPPIHCKLKLLVSKRLHDKFIFESEQLNILDLTLSKNMNVVFGYGVWILFFHFMLIRVRYVRTSKETNVSLL
jgi:hypothetical protein